MSIAIGSYRPAKASFRALTDVAKGSQSASETEYLTFETPERISPEVMRGKLPVTR